MAIRLGLLNYILLDLLSLKPLRGRVNVSTFNLDVPLYVNVRFKLNVCL